MTAITLRAGLVVATLATAACSQAPSAPSDYTDLGEVLDRTETVLVGFSDYVDGSGSGEELTDEDMDGLADLLAMAYNTPEAVSSRTVGVDFRTDGAFLGFDDRSGDNAQGAAEPDLFTVELDIENSRIIATDVTGAATERRMSGTGFLAGYVAGRMLTRQRGAGVGRMAFNNRSVTPRAQYSSPARARSSVRTGGARVGK